jgi:hypothetical protein
MRGLGPRIHVLLVSSTTWMAGTSLVRGPAKPDPSAGHDTECIASLVMPASSRPKDGVLSHAYGPTMTTNCKT